VTSWGGSPSHTPSTVGRQAAEGSGWACPPSWVGTGTGVALWQRVLSGEPGGFCSHPPPLSYIGFSIVSSQPDSSELRVLRLAVPARPHRCCPSTSAARRGTAPASCRVSLGARQHPVPISTPASRGCPPCWGDALGQSQPALHPMETEGKGPQHCSPPPGGPGFYRDPRLTAGPFLCSLQPRSLTQQRAACQHHLPPLVLALQLLHVHQRSRPAAPGQPLLQPGHQHPGAWGARRPLGDCLLLLQLLRQAPAPQEGWAGQQQSQHHGPGHPRRFPVAASAPAWLQVRVVLPCLPHAVVDQEPHPAQRPGGLQLQGALPQAQGPVGEGAQGAGGCSPPVARVAPPAGQRRRRESTAPSLLPAAE